MPICLAPGKTGKPLDWPRLKHSKIAHFLQCSVSPAHVGNSQKCLFFFHPEQNKQTLVKPYFLIVRTLQLKENKYGICVRQLMR
jgi:hypothetical protein